MDGTRFVIAGKFIDGRGTDVRRNVFLAMKDSVITEIGSAADLPRHDGSVIDDFSRHTVLPALIDCSVSLTRSPSVDPRVQHSTQDADSLDKNAMTERHIGYCHSHGVLGLVDSDDAINRIRQLQAHMTGSFIGIRTSGCLYRNMLEFASFPPASSDFLKIAYSANIEDEEDASLRFTSDDLRRILQKKGDKKSVVIANGPQQVAEAIAAGSDAIEQGYAMGEDNLRKIAEKKLLWIPSVLRAKNALDAAGAGGSVCCRFSTRYVAPGKPVPGAKAFWKKMLNEHLAQLRLARELGVQTATGTGAGSVGIIHGESMIEEMKLFLKAGYSLEETIQCASENSAEFFNINNLGALTVGKRATFLITTPTLQQLPRKLSYLESIFIDGAPSLSYRKNPVKTV